MGEIKKQLADEKEKKKQEQKECLRAKKKNKIDHQNELKKRWSAYEEGDDFSKQAKKSDEINSKLNDKKEKKKLKEEKDLKIQAEREALKIKEDSKKQHQKELKEKWNEQERKRKNEKKDKIVSKVQPDLPEEQNGPIKSEIN